MTIQTLADTAGVDVRSIFRWQAAGLLEAPEITAMPGRGRSGRWQQAMVKRCRRIADLRREGWSLPAIKATLEQEFV